MPELTEKGDLTAIRFNVSKLSAVEVTITKGDEGWRSTGSPPSGAGRARSCGGRARAGLYTVKLGAKELRTGLGLKDRGSTEIEVEPDPEA